MRSNVVVKELSINVASADQSYMPQRVVVSGGRDEMNMRELNDVRIPRYNCGHCLSSLCVPMLPVLQNYTILKLYFKIKCKKLRRLRLKCMLIRTILYRYISILIKRVFLLNFRHELFMSF